MVPQWKKKKAVLLKMSFLMPRSFQEGFPIFTLTSSVGRGREGLRAHFHETLANTKRHYFRKHNYLFFHPSDVAHWLAANYLTPVRVTPFYRNVHDMPFSLPDQLAEDRWLTLKVQWLWLGTRCKIRQGWSLLFGSCDHTWKSLGIPESRLVCTKHEGCKGRKRCLRDKPACPESKEKDRSIISLQLGIPPCLFPGMMLFCSLKAAPSW